MKPGPLESDTIAAVATPPGRGALGIVRVSGRAAIPICDHIFRGKLSLRQVQDRSVVLGDVVRGDGTALDQVLVLVMRGPQTATGEDVVEITCHGGVLIPRVIMRRLTEEGARPAEPGEFTKRAFLNGKMDLTQAEAVEDLVRATSEKALEVALRQLRGELGEAVGGLERDLLAWLVVIEANIDFGDEAEVGAVDAGGLAGALAAVSARLKSLLDAHERGKYVRDGLDVAIVGKQNVGKSSLFNRLVGYDRVIVSDVPGTTRDAVDGLVGVDGVVVRLHDTAGIGRAGDGVEAEAMRRTREILASSDIAVVVVDASAGVTADDVSILEGVPAADRLVVANKVDLPVAAGWEGMWEEMEGRLGERERRVKVSALTGEGLPELVGRLGDLAKERVGDLGCEIGVNERHAAALAEALGATRRAAALLGGRAPLEFLASDIRWALDCLGGITGERVASSVLEEIFARFCIGK